MTEFKVGQKVKCIEDFTDFKDFFVPFEYIMNYPVKDETYTIRKVIEAWDEYPDGGESLYFEEITNPPYEFMRGTLEFGFPLDRFEFVN
jgi:hypothetical protein